MDYKEIQNINLRGKSKEEIISVLSDILGEYGLAFEYEMLKEVLSPEQIEILDKAIEEDTRAFAQEEHPDVDEEEISDWIEEDKKDRRLAFSRDEDGKIMLSDIDSRMQDMPEIGEVDFSDVDITTFVDTVKKGIEYTSGNWYTPEQHSKYGIELSAIEEQLSNFSVSLKAIEECMKKAESGEISPDTLLEIMQLTGASFSVSELATLVSPSDAKTAQDALIEDANQIYQPNEMLSETDAQVLREEHIAMDYYKVANVGNRMVLRAPRSLGLPQLYFDNERINTPEFRETIIESLGRNMDDNSSRFNGFFGEELKGLIDLAISSRGIDAKGNDIKAFTEEIARDPEVVSAIPDAKESFENIIKMDVIGKETKDQDKEM